MAAAGVWLLTPLTVWLAWRVGAIDHPNPRKIHVGAIPRLGGLAVITVVIAAWSLMRFAPELFGQQLPPEFITATLLGLIPVLAISIMDDIRSVRAHWKLAAHTSAAIITVSLGLSLPSEVHLFDTPIALGYAVPVLSVFWILSVTNAFNLVDGLDGLSAGLALLSAISLAALALITVGPNGAAPAVVLVGALIGFLPYNLYPAKVFLGDAGATSIGFCLACLSLRSGATLSSGMAVLVPLFVIGVPVAETVLSVARRALRRLAQLGRGRVLDPDKDHIHHRLLAMGLDHRRAVLLLYGVNALVVLVGLASMFLTARNAALLLTALLIAAFIGVRRLGYDEFAVIRRGVLLRFYDAPVLNANLFPVFFDLAVVTLSIYVAIGLKFDDWSVHTHRKLALNLLAVLPLVAVTVFAASKVYRGSWRHASVEDLTRGTAAVGLAAGLSFILARMLLDDPPGLSFFAIYGMSLVIAFNSARASFRILKHWGQRQDIGGEGVVIYGAGTAGALAAREILSNRSLGMHPVGFIDDDPAKQGRYLNGFLVYAPSDIDRLIDGGHVTGVIISSHAIHPKMVDNLRLVCELKHVRFWRFQIILKSAHVPAFENHLVAVGGFASSRQA